MKGLILVRLIYISPHAIRYKKSLDYSIEAIAGNSCLFCIISTLKFVVMKFNNKTILSVLITVTLPIF